MVKPATDLEPGFKMTELGPLPEEWEVVELKNTINPKKTSLNPQDYPEEIFDYYSIPAYQESKRAFLEEGQNIRSQKLLVEDGTVLFGKLNPRVSKVWLVSDSERRKIASTEFVPLKPISSKTQSDFLYYLCWSRHILPKSRELVSGSTPSRQRVDIKAFLDLPIPLPSLPEQRAIARVLRTVQRARETTEAVIQAAARLKRSLMRHLFTYGPVPVDQAEQVKLKDTEIGPVPEKWEVVKLGILAKAKYGKAKPKEEGGIPVIGSGGIYGWCSKPLVDFPTLIIGRKGTAGKVWLQEAPCWPSDTAFYLDWVEADGVDRYFVYQFIRLNPLSGEHAKTTLPSLTKPDLEGYLIPYPPLPEQHKISRILSTVDRKIETEQARKAALDNLFATLLANLMTGKIRVKVGERLTKEE